MLMKVLINTAYIYILLSRDALTSFSSIVQDIPGFVKSHLTEVIFEKFPCNPHPLKKFQQMKNTVVQKMVLCRHSVHS